MEDASAIARRAAGRLADTLDPNLPAFTERVLAGGGSTGETRTFDLGITLAIASLVVSATQLSWQIYHDLRKDREERQAKEAPDPEDRRLLIRRLQMRVGEVAGLPPADRQRLIEVVAEETMVAAHPRGREG